MTTPGEGAFDYAYGDVVSFVATPDPNYRFVGWSGTTADQLVCPACPSVLMRIAESGTLVAQFEYIAAWYPLDVSSSEGGVVLQPGEGTFTYPKGSVVTLLASHEKGWEFHSWTGTAVDFGKVADPTDYYTTLTMQGCYSLQANFVRFGTVLQYILTIHPTAGGETYPNLGMHKYYEGAEVTIRADAMEGYRFTGWTGTSVDAGAVANPASASTTVTMNADYTITANFKVAGSIVLHALTISSGDGGYVATPGEGAFQYEKGINVSVLALADDGHQFVSWSGSAVDAGKVANPATRSTAVLMDADYTLTANFEPSADPGTSYILTTTSTEGGQVSVPGTGSFLCYDGEQVPVVAQANSGYQFLSWTGAAVDAGKVANPTSASTSVTMSNDYSLCANFTPMGQGPASIRVLAPQGNESLVAGSIVSVAWQIQGNVAFVNIELSVDGGTTWTQISQHSAAAGSCRWEVPPVDSDRCLIRISSADNAGVSDVSDALFHIRDATNRIWYVDTAAAGAGDGTSWADALVCLQDALIGAIAGDSILVAEGLYWPDLGGGRTVGDRNATFHLKVGVAVYGGFPAGGGEWSRRNPATYRSILSGDIGKPGVALDNSYHVVTADHVAKSAVLDGCTVADGYANGDDLHARGAGLCCLWSSPHIRNCTFARNLAAGDGGGTWVTGAAATFVNCVFTGNTAGNYGGGLYNEQGTVTIINCTLTANKSAWRGGGLFNSAGATTVANSILWNNSGSYGNSCEEWTQAAGDPRPKVAYCCIQGWTGSLGGDGCFSRDPQFVDAAGPDARAGTPDDDLRLLSGSPCIDAGNAAILPSGITTDLSGEPRVHNHLVDIGAYEFVRLVDGEVCSPLLQHTDMP